MSHTPFARFVGSDSTTSREALERLQKVETMRDELLEALKEANKELRGGIKEKTTALIAKAEGKS